ncbi:hypothetical protein EXIGLDRAFT_723159 [Exidia glandulosa HHB12029]|uniref:Uncharacterized protein n=1 Tax=Exidia glandulosa HHB12029 TaxID=1314781 RepID=A0A165MZT0_EXIGL|nr:hypothetical protein EXIGLDRAFT_723159 [Exidia glandulosa HHB12029]
MACRPRCGGFEYSKYSDWTDRNVVLMLMWDANEIKSAKAAIPQPTTPSFYIPPILRDKCFVPFSLDISVGGPTICLARNVLELASTQLEEAFAGRCCSPNAEESAPTDVLHVTAICTPHLDGLEVTDAAVRYLAHRLQADVVIFDPVDLAKGPSGPFGEGA